MKKGDLVLIKESNQKGIIVFASTTLEEPFYLVKNFAGFVFRDIQGEIKEFSSEDLEQALPF